MAFHRPNVICSSRKTEVKLSWIFSRDKWIIMKLCEETVMQCYFSGRLLLKFDTVVVVLRDPIFIDITIKHEKLWRGKKWEEMFETRCGCLITESIFVFASDRSTYCVKIGIKY